MDVVGLPTAVQVALEALLSENRLTSWKVSAEGRSTVVVLRLTGPDSPNMATHTTTDQRFRLKPPSQIRRDRRRAEDRATRQQQDKASLSFSPTPLFFPTPEKTFRTQSRNDVSKKSTATQYDTPVTPPFRVDSFARENHEKAEASTDFEGRVSQPASDKCVVSPLQLSDWAGENINIDTDRGSEVMEMHTEEGEEERADTEERAKKAGFDLDEIRDEVGKVMDRKTQRCLRDDRLNQRLFHTVLDTRRGQRVLVCESDSIVLRYDIVKQRVSGWYIRSSKQTYTELERDSMRCLYREPRVNKTEFKEELDRATADLQVLAAVVRLFLG